MERWRFGRNHGGPWREEVLPNTNRGKHKFIWTPLGRIVRFLPGQYSRKDEEEEMGTIETYYIDTGLGLPPV